MVLEHFLIIGRVFDKRGNMLEQKNVISQNYYYGKNQLNLSFVSEQKEYKSNEWGTFLQWKNLKRMVQKGEKSEVIIKPVKNTILNSKTGEEETKNGMKRYRVFNKDQTKEVA